MIVATKITNMTVDVVFNTDFFKLDTLNRLDTNS